MDASNKIPTKFKLLLQTKNGSHFKLKMQDYKEIAGKAKL